jgi:hypothetical protein
VTEAFQSDGLVPSQSTCQEQGQEDPIPFSFHATDVGCLPESPALVGRQPVPKANALLLHALYPANAGSKVRTEKTAVGCLIRQPAYCPQSQVDSA